MLEDILWRKIKQGDVAEMKKGRRGHIGKKMYKDLGRIARDRRSIGRVRVLWRPRKEVESQVQDHKDVQSA